MRNVFFIIVILLLSLNFMSGQVLLTKENFNNQDYTLEFKNNIEYKIFKNSGGKNIIHIP